MLTVLRNESTALIDLRVREGAQLARVERAIRDSIAKGGLTVDAVSDATGFTPAEIRAILAKPVDIEDFDVLSGAV